MHLKFNIFKILPSIFQYDLKTTYAPQNSNISQQKGILYLSYKVKITCISLCREKPFGRNKDG